MVECVVDEWLQRGCVLLFKYKKHYFYKLSNFNWIVALWILLWLLYGRHHNYKDNLWGDAYTFPSYVALRRICYFDFIIAINCLCYPFLLLLCFFYYRLITIKHAINVFNWMCYIMLFMYFMWSMEWKHKC